MRQVFGHLDAHTRASNRGGVYAYSGHWTGRRYCLPHDVRCFGDGTDLVNVPRFDLALDPGDPRRRRGSRFCWNQIAGSIRRGLPLWKIYPDRAVSHLRSSALPPVTENLQTLMIRRIVWQGASTLHQWRRLAPARRRLYFRTPLRAARAELYPHIPWTPPPGGVDEEQI